MSYQIRYGPPQERQVRDLKLAEVIPALDEMKAKGVAYTLHSPDGQVADEHAVRLAIQGNR